MTTENWTADSTPSQKGKTILITGASSGIGKETAKLFQSKGWNVIATMRNPENGSELKQLENVLVAKLDVLDLDSIQNAFMEGAQKFGSIDVLLNNAGYGAYGPLEVFSREQVLRQFNTNVIGLLDVTRTVLPHFRQNKKGIIINISSIGGKMTFPMGSLYHGTKFAVEGISESLSYEVAQFGGQVKIVEPGMIATDFSGRSLDSARNLKSGNEAISLIKKKNANAKLDLMQLDLSDFASIHQFSLEFYNKYKQLDVLINNAGVMFPAKRELTRQKFEIQFGTNHLGHFLLTGLLLDLLESTPNSRIAIQSSGQHKAKMGKPDIHFDDLTF